MTSLHQHLLAERQAIEQFLSNIPDSRIIERNTWLSRLSDLDAEIEKQVDVVSPARTTITYRGRRVVGSHGIASTFGLAATRAYTNIIQLMAAQWFRTSPLGERGRVSDSEKFDLLVVAPAYGSFGFELEEPVGQQLTLEERSLLSQAIEKTQTILQSTLESDDEIAEAIGEVDTRVLAAVRAFLSVLKKNDTTCAIKSGDRDFHFDTTTQVARSLERLGQKNIERKEELLEGEFQGYLPLQRNFQFKIKADGREIVGKINTLVADIEDINLHLYQPARIRTISHRVGAGRPRYVLVQNPDWLEDNGTQLHSQPVQPRRGRELGSD